MRQTALTICSAATQDVNSNDFLKASNPAGDMPALKFHEIGWLLHTCVDIIQQECCCALNTVFFKDQKMDACKTVNFANGPKCHSHPH